MGERRKQNYFHLVSTYLKPVYIPGSSLSNTTGRDRLAAIFFQHTLTLSPCPLHTISLSCGPSEYQQFY